MSEKESAWRITADGLSLRIKASPRASRAQIKGIVPLPDGAALAVALTAPPVDGAANAALIALIAEVMQVPRRAIRLESGDTARIKRLSISGHGPDLAQRLARALADQKPG